MAYAKAPDRHQHVCSPSCRDGCPPLFKELASLLSSRSDRLRRQLSEHYTHVDIMQLAINEIERCRLMVEALEAKLQKLQHAADVQKQYPPRRIHSNSTTVANPNAQIEPTLSIGRNWFYASDAGLALIRLSDLRIMDCNTSFVSTQYFEGPAPSSREQAIGTVWIQGMPPRRIARALDAVSRLIVAEDGVLHIPHLTVVDHHNRIRQLKSITLFLSNDGKTPADQHSSHPAFLVQVVHAAQNFPLLQGTSAGAPALQIEEETDDPRLSEHQAIFISTNPEKKQKKSPTQNSNSPQSDTSPNAAGSATATVGSLPPPSSHTSPPFLPATHIANDPQSSITFAPPPVVPLLPVPPLPPRASRGSHRTEHGSMLNHIGLVSASPASLYQWMSNAVSSAPPGPMHHRLEDIRSVLSPDSNSSTDS